MRNIVSLLSAASLIPAAAGPDDQGEAEEGPPQQMPPPTAFTIKFDELEKLAGEDGAMADLAARVHKLAIEEEPGLWVAVVDLTRSLTPAPPPGTGVPKDHVVSLSPTSIVSASSSSYSAAVGAVAAAKRAKASMADITGSREGVHRMQELD
jgi:hypothetical protein